MPMMAFRMARPAHLIDINPVDGLNRLAVEENALSIAACVRHAVFIDRSLRVRRVHFSHRLPYRALPDQVKREDSAVALPMPTWHRNGADGGNARLGNCCGEPTGPAAIASDKFFEGTTTTALAEDELLVEARLPLLSPDTRCGFYEFSRAPAITRPAMALVTFRRQDGIIVEPRIGIGERSCGPAVFPRRRLFFRCQAGYRELPHRAEAAAAAIDPMEDVHADAEFRLIWCAP